jgi:aminobenzoyl-glutamate transport protein
MTEKKQVGSTRQGDARNDGQDDGHDKGRNGGRRGRILPRLLNAVERAGNRLPDPALLFFLMMLATWALAALLSGTSFSTLDPRTGAPLEVRNLLAGTELTTFVASMVTIFVTFPPFGIVLVAMLGIGLAEYTGFVRAALRGLLSLTARWLLTPLVVAVGILSHTAVDAGYVLVVPLGGVIFHAAGRHPLAGIAAAFAGVSGGFSAGFLPSSLDPMLSGISEAAGRILAPDLAVNPLNNYFTTTSSLLIVGAAWWLTDRVVEPRLRGTVVDGDLKDLPSLETLDVRERRALAWALVSMVAGLALLLATALPGGSPWRDPAGALTGSAAPLMKAIVPLIFLLFLVPGVTYGILAGTVKTHRDVIAGMSHAMSGMGYYIVMAFFAAQFIHAFSQSNLGALVALEGAALLKAMTLPAPVTLTGIVIITTLVNLLVGSASAKWTLLAPILVPMMMSLGLSPDVTQAAYRVGDSSTNIITPLMPYFPLIVVFCRRYVQGAGIGTLAAMMLPYAVTFLVLWVGLLLVFWGLELPLGLQARYDWPG